MSTNTQGIKQWSRFIPFAGIVLALGLTLTFIAVKAHSAHHVGAAMPAVSAGVLRGRAADAARYGALAQYFAAKEAADLLRSRAADAARYEAIAQYFVRKAAADLTRSRAADAARYEAMAQYYARKKADELAQACTAAPGR